MMHADTNTISADQQVNAALNQQLDNAIKLQQAGQLEAAKNIYCEVIAKDPTNANAWHLLGMTLYSGGIYPDAIECLQKAIAFSGESPTLLGHLALIEHASDNSLHAIALLNKAIELDPDNTELVNNLGVLLLELGQLKEAQAKFEIVLKRQPEFTQASMNLANCLVRQNQLYDAEAIYRQLLERIESLSETSGGSVEDENKLDILGNLGECLRRQCRLNESIEVLNQVIKARPNDLVSRLTHARSFVKLGQHQEAKELFTGIIDEFPGCSKAMHYLATTLQDLGDLKGAEEQLYRSLELSPNDAHALCSLGFIHIESERRDEARICFEKAISIDNSMSEVHGCLVYLMTGDPEVSPQQLFEAHKQWGEAYGCKQPFNGHSNDRTETRKLRIGYASADLRQHAVAGFFEPLLRLRDNEQFETFCYYEHTTNDSVTEKLKAMTDHWRVTFGFSDQQVFQQVLDDQIDILVDLSGHTFGNRLTAWSMKPAPIQISWLGYPNTTGLKAIDYTFTCEVQNPPDEPTWHTEQLLRIPGGSFSFLPPEHAPELTPLPADTKGHITFGSLHRPFKISAKTHDFWAAALHANPDAHLLAFNTRFNDRSMAELRAALVERGIEDARIDIQNQFTGKSYLEIYKEIDIGLDVTPWAGGTTTMQALWMGVPMIAIYGNNRPSRGTAGIVHHLGYPQWIAKDESEYGEKLGQLASDLDQLRELRKSLRQQTVQTIADEQRFVTEVEKAYRAIWRHWCQSSSATSSPALHLPIGSMDAASRTNV